MLSPILQLLYCLPDRGSFRDLREPVTTTRPRPEPYRPEIPTPGMFRSYAVLVVLFAVVAVPFAALAWMILTH